MCLGKFLFEIHTIDHQTMQNGFSAVRSTQRNALFIEII